MIYPGKDTYRIDNEEDSLNISSQDDSISLYIIFIIWNNIRYPLYYKISSTKVIQNMART